MRSRSRSQKDEKNNENEILSRIRSRSRRCKKDYPSLYCPEVSHTLYYIEQAIDINVTGLT